MANAPTILAAVALGGLALLLAAAGPGAAQNCGCQPNFCCSRFGFCGQTTEYCGDGCQSGPCIRGGGGANVANVVTDAFFNGIKNQAPSSCEGKNFYTRGAFLNAVNSYSGFARGGSEVEGKREIAAFFAHVTHETGYFCYISEINKNDPHTNRTSPPLTRRRRSPPPPPRSSPSACWLPFVFPDTDPRHPCLLKSPEDTLISSRATSGSYTA